MDARFSRFFCVILCNVVAVCETRQKRREGKSFKWHIVEGGYKYVRKQQILEATVRKMINENKQMIVSKSTDRKFREFKKYSEDSSTYFKETEQSQFIWIYANRFVLFFKQIDSWV